MATSPMLRRVHSRAGAVVCTEKSSRNRHVLVKPVQEMCKQDRRSRADTIRWQVATAQSVHAMCVRARNLEMVLSVRLHVSQPAPARGCFARRFVSCCAL